MRVLHFLCVYYTFYASITLCVRVLHLVCVYFILYACITPCMRVFVFVCMYSILYACLYLWATVVNALSGEEPPVSLVIKRLKRKF